MPWVGFKPTIPAFELAKKVHALDRTATVIGFLKFISMIIIIILMSYACLRLITKHN
jgi:hypothetical protein